MAATNDDRTSRALDILRSAPFSRVVNAFVLPSDTFYQLVDILEGGVAADGPEEAEPGESATPKKGGTTKKRGK